MGKMANVTRSGRKLKDDDGNSSKRKQIGGKGLTSSGSVSTDTSGLRRSTRETPSKKQRASSPSRKSERIEKHTPPTPPIKRKYEQVEKQKMQSPPRRSDRVETNHSLSYSGSKKSEKGSSSLNIERKKKKMEKRGKQTTPKTGDQRRNEKKCPKPSHIILKKKRLAYIAYFKPKTKESDLGEKLKVQNELSQGDSDDAGASDTKEVEEDEDECSKGEGEEVRGIDPLGESGACGTEIVGGDRDECTEREGEKVTGIDLEEDCLRDGEAGSRKFAEGTSKNHQEIELSHLSRNHKKCPEDSHESKHGDGSTVSKYGDSLLQSFPDGIIAKETVGDADWMQVDCSKREELRKPEYALEGDKICTSNTDDVSSSLSGCKRSNFPARCVRYSKRPRGNFVSENCDVYSCSSQENHDLCDTSSLKEVCEQASICRSPQNDVMLESCIQKDGIQDVGLVNEKREDVGSVLLAEAQRNIVHNHSDVRAMVDNPIIPEENGEELENRVCTRFNEECCNDVQQKESPLDIQTKIDNYACFICKLGGILLCCDGNGCKKRCHRHCLDPPLKDVPPGVWYCVWCVKKKIESGVHSVSGGVESIWDVREGEVSNCKGIQKQKQYLVKYKGLAHVHNLWVSEDHLLLEAPGLVAKFKKNQALTWNSDWSKPHRLLRKRLLMSPKQRDEYLSESCCDISNCQYEWFVKWSGLGYEHATWELENASFMQSPEALTLIRDYESRLERAKRVSDPSKAANKGRKGSFSKLSKFPGIGLPGVDNDNLHFVNKLREYWHKGQNAVVLEDQERVFKVISFILSLLPNACRPFLIISTSSGLSAWEDEFLRLAPSLNVVIYNGKKDVRESIQTLEFYEESGCIMFEVLLSPLDAIVEDLDVLECIGWEAIIVDECQYSGVSKHFEQIKMLTTEFRLLLFCGQIKDSIPEYLNLLSFIDSGGDGNNFGNLKIGSNYIGKLKERFAQFVVFERKSDSSKFVEYWVPVRLSHVQLEQYCATLLSNSISLRSCSKNDPVGALRDILISTRKCCDHPYLVNESLQSSLTNDLPEGKYLEVGINASGKLQVLDNVLPEIRKQGLRVLILFQSIGGSGRNSIGDILDDFLRQRFGPDTYERIDSGLVSSKKQAALSMFNNKERGRFAFLIENRACHPSIKLSSVDIIILFDSDWNPLNDLRALQRITIDSHFEQIKVFRLYSSCTVEEKVLILAKQDVILDSNIQNINRGISHTLLIWGASYLFKELDEFHGSSTPSSCSITSNQLFLSKVVQELLTQLPHDTESNNTRNCSIIVKVKQSGAKYPGDISLLGELEMQSSDKELPHIFWRDLLEGKCPQWRYLSGSSQRVRKKVQYFDVLQKRLEIESDEVIKKRKKVINATVDPISLKSLEGESGPPAGNGSHNLPRSTTNTNAADHPWAEEILELPEVHIVESEEKRNFCDSQKNLHLFLKPKISRVCEILQLPDNVNSMAGRFLEYIMNNHHVPREPITILQAFQISLCWSAASLLKHKINRKESLALAWQHLNFECKEEEAQLLYSKLRVLKKMFSDRAENVLVSNSAEDPAPRTKGVGKHLLHVVASQSIASDQQELEEGEIRESPKSHSCSNEPVSVKQELASDSEKACASPKNQLSKLIKEVKKIHSRRKKELLQKQFQEFQEFNKNRKQCLEKGKAKLEGDRKLESALIRALHGQTSVGLDKLKMVDQHFERKMKELHCHMDIQEKTLEAMHRAAREKEKLMRDHWLEEAKSGRPVTSFSCLPLPDSGFRLHMEASEQGGVGGHEKATSVSVPTSEHGSDGFVLDGMVSDEVPEIVPNEVVEVGILTEQLTPTLKSGRPKSGIDAMASERGIVTGDKQRSRGGVSDNGSTTSLELTQVDSPLAQQPTTSIQDTQVCLVQAPSSEQPHLLSSSAGVQGECVSGCEMQNSSHQIEIPSLQLAVTTPFHQSNETADQPSVVQSQVSPLTDPLSTEHCQLDVPMSMGVEHEQMQQSQSPVDDQVELFNHTGQPLTTHVQPDHQSTHYSSQQTQLLTQALSGDHTHSVLQMNVQLQPPPSVDATLGGRSRSLDPRSMAIVSETSNCSPQTAHMTTQVEHHPQLMHNSSQQTQVLTQALSGDHTRSVLQTNIQLQPRPSLDTALGGRTHSLDPRSMGIVSESSNRIPRTPHVTSRIPQFLHPDPLQNELARIRTEEDKAIKMHEDAKKQLNLECEKEIGEIRRKYNSLLQDADTALEQKRKALDTNYNKVFMNRVLAEAFRLKCGDARAGVPGLRQGEQPGFLLQLLQLLSQKNTQRPASVPGLAAAPPVQVVHHSSALFSSNMVRPPHITPIIPPRGNSLAGIEIRTPAPHLQSLRSATFVSSAPILVPFTSAAPGQQSLSIPAATCSILPHLTPHAPTYPPGPSSGMHQQESSDLLPFTSSAPVLVPFTSAVPGQQSLNIPAATSSILPHLTPRAPTYPPGPSSGMQQQESSNLLPFTHNSSLPGLGLLRDVDFHSGANPPSLFPPLQDLGSTFDACDLSELATEDTLGAPAAPVVGAADIVCLSDDD